MNNKRVIWLLVLAALLVAGCTERHNKSIDSAYQLLTTAPDSSLSILNGVKSSDLSKSERARFALFYTIAQDKSGLDVDNDSLLRIAYTYYNNKAGVTIQFRPSCNQTKNPEVIPGIFCIGMAEVV